MKGYGRWMKGSCRIRLAWVGCMSIILNSGCWWSASDSNHQHATITRYAGVSLFMIVTFELPTINAQKLWQSRQWILWSSMMKQRLLTFIKACAALIIIFWIFLMKLKQYQQFSLNHSYSPRLLVILGFTVDYCIAINTLMYTHNLWCGMTCNILMV